MIALVKAICATEEVPMISAAEEALGAILNGAVAIRHMRMYPQFMEEAVSRVLHEPSVNPEGIERQ
jgi:hypothetical protein